MGGERLWWTWGMGGRGTVPNTILLIYTAEGVGLWNSSEQDAFNGTVGYNNNSNSSSSSGGNGGSSSSNSSGGSNSSDGGNGTWPSDEGPLRGHHDLIATIVTASVLSLVILVTVVVIFAWLVLVYGNVFVIAAILLERNLQSVANYLILSLAVADLFVACLVMPLGAVYEVADEWALGPELCDMWTSSDVLCCTASILHLVAIALDRYWAVTNIDYIHHRTARRIGLMIAVVWMVAFLVCIAPLLGWKDPLWEHRVVALKSCSVSQDIGYQIFATVMSFYLPLIVLLILYWRIFQSARKRIRRRPGQQTIIQGTTKTMGPPKPIGSSHAVGGALVQAQVSGGIAAAVVAVIGRPLPTISETTTQFTTVSSPNTSPEKTSYNNGLDPDPPTLEASPKPAASRRKKIAAESKKERKAAKTLLIITGAFVVCWLPFFLIAILDPICQSYAACEINQRLIAFFQWLGYFNSTLNPLIYTVFSPEFRNAFKKLLCRRRRGVGRRMAGRHYM